MQVASAQNRADRRRRLRQDEQALARGLRAEPLHAAEVMALMRVLHDRLLESRSAGSVAPLTSFLYSNAAAAGRAGPVKWIACGRGCAHCCHAWVSARAPEVLAVKAAIPRAQLEATRAAIADTFRLIDGLDLDQRSALAAPCPMLRDGRCQVYAARPLTCRSAVSMDAAICALAFAPGAGPHDLPVPDFYPTLKRGYSLALAGALRREGYAMDSYEFNAALQAAMARSDAEAAWLAGEPVFAGIPFDPGSDPFRHPRNAQLYDAAWS